MREVGFAETGGVRTRYARFGEGERNLVILPGLSVRPVSPSIDALASAFSDYTKEFCVCLLDRREDAPEDYTIKEMADDAVAALGALGIERFSLFGASQGGMIALQIAEDHPAAVERLVLASTASSLPSRSPIADWIDLASRGEDRALAVRMVNEIYSPATVSRFGDALIAASSDLSPAERRQFLALARATATLSVAPRLGEIACPTLVVGSRGDRIFGVPDLLALADGIGCPLYLYPAAFGHAVYDEAPDFRPRMLEFLRGK